MEEELENLKVLINAETAQFRKEMQNVQRNVKGTAKVVDKETTKIGNSFNKLGGIIKGALIGLGLFKLGKDAIEMASNIDEVQNVVETAFGSMTPLVEKFAKTSIDQLGMSELTFKRTASTMMAMSKGMGFVGREAADMAIEVTRMTGDMASFYNVQQDVAETALKSIWTGETESLKKFGVVMTQANLQQFAMKNGMNANIQAMSQQEQLMLRYRYVMDSLSLAQGDFAKTQDSWANQTRILSERFKELLSIIGSGLIQVLLPVIKLLNMLFSMIINIGKALALVFGKSDSTAKNFKAINNASVGAGSTGAPALGKLGNAAEKAGKQAKGALASFDDLNVLASDLGSGANGSGSNDIPVPNFSGGGNFEPIDLDTDNVKTQADLIAEHIKKAMQDAKKQFKQASDFAKIHFGGIWENFYKKASQNFSKTIVISKKMWEDVKSLGKPLLDWAQTDLVNGFKVSAESISTIFNGMWETTLTVIEDTWSHLVFPVSENFFTTLLPLVSQVNTEIINSFTVAFTTIKDVFDLLWKDFGVPILDAFTTVWNDTMIMLKDFWDAHGKPIFNEINRYIKNLGDRFITLWENILKPIFDNFSKVLNELWHSFLKPLVANILDIIAIVAEALLKLWNHVIFPLTQFIMNVFGPTFKFVFGIIGDVVSGAARLVGGVVNGLLQVFKGIIQFITGIFTGDWKKAWDGIVNIFGGIWSAIKSIVKTTWDFILGLFSKGGQIFSGIVDGIGNIFKSIINALLRGINWVIAKPIDVMNGVLNWIKDVNVMGFKPFNGFWGYSPIPKPQIPYLDVGTNYVARDGLAYIHQGEAVVPKKFNKDEFFGMGNAEQIALLQEQNELLRLLLEKDNSVYLNGKDIQDENAKLEKRLNKRFDYD